MTDNDSKQTAQDDTTNGLDFGMNRRTALKTGAVGLSAIGLGGLTGSSVVANDPANKPAAAGSTVDILSSAEGSGASKVETLLELNNVKTSGSEQDTLVFQPTIESSIFTRVSSDGTKNGNKNKDKDGTSGWDSVATAGVLAWIEVAGDETGGAWKMVDVEGNITDEDPIQNESDFVDSDGNLTGVADSVVVFNSRDFKLEWDIQELIDDVKELQRNVDNVEETEEYDLLLDLLMRTRSANGFNWLVRPINGVNDVRLRGALYDFTYSDEDTDSDAEARAVINNRTMLVQPMKLPHDIS